MSSQLIMHSYNEKSKNTCTLVSISLIFIVAYFTIPYKASAFNSFLIKIIVLGILGATIFYQFKCLHQLLNIEELFTKEENNSVRKQYIIGAFFSVILVCFFLFISKEMFF